MYTVDTSYGLGVDSSGFTQLLQRPGGNSPIPHRVLEINNRQLGLQAVAN